MIGAQIWELKVEANGPGVNFTTRVWVEDQRKRRTRDPARRTWVRLAKAALRTRGERRLLGRVVVHSATPIASIGTVLR